MKLISEKFKNWLLPLLFGCAVAYMIIDCYHRGDTLEFTIGFFAYAFILFAVFDVIRKIKYISGILYLAFAAIVLYFSVRPALQVSFSGSAGLSFNQWFYGVQSAATLVPSYSVALIIGGGFFFVSILYYFTQVIYRSFGTMLIIMFPLVIYSKRSDELNSLQFVIVLCLYIAILIHNRQMKSDKNAVVIVNKSYSLSIAVFVAVITLIVGFMPTPEILSRQEIDNNYFDELTSTAPTGYSDSSSGTGGALSEDIIMYVYTDSPCYLRRQSYDYYNNGAWNNDHTNQTSNIFPDDFSQYYTDMSNTSLINAFTSFRELLSDTNNDFNYPETELSPIETKRITIVPAEGFYPYYICSPLNTISVYERGTENKVFNYGKNMHGEFMPLDYKNYRTFTNGYTLEYIQNPGTLYEVCEQLSMTSDDELSAFFNMILYNADDEIFRTYLNNSSYVYELFNSNNDEVFDEMQRIALEVTSQCETPYEKAKVLESYFEDNGFEYDPRYVPLDSSPEYFVTQSKRGTCGDFATAMTLMARYVGLNARYVEGFVVDEAGEDEDGNQAYIVREKHSHAYVEVYIPGAGWMVFEPTVSGFLDYTYEEEMELSDYFLIIIRYLAVIALIVIVLYLLRRKITEIVFKIRFHFADNNKAVVLCYNRLLNHAAYKFKIDTRTMTSGQVSAYLRSYGVEPEIVIQMFERTFYGSRPATDNDKINILISYKAVVKQINKTKLSGNNLKYN